MGQNKNTTTTGPSTHDQKTRRSRCWPRGLSGRHFPRKDGLVRRNLRGSTWYMPLSSRHPLFLNVKPTPDMRLPSSQEAAQQRSINLAISSRGIAAMRAIDSAAASRFLDNVIPMRGRMIHDSDGNLDSQPYDRDGQVGNIFSPFHRSFTPLYRLCVVPEFPCS